MAALARLQASLQQGGELGEVALDTERRDALLLLVARLQASLSLPPAPAPPALAAKTPDLVECPPAISRRFANRRQRHNRHTVGVTREELADARRWLEEQAASGSASPAAVATPSGAGGAGDGPREAAPAPAASSPARGGGASPARQYTLLKQSSAGELGASPVDALTPAQKAFRPVRFVPGRSKSATQEKERALAPAGHPPTSQHDTPPARRSPSPGVKAPTGPDSAPPLNDRVVSNKSAKDSAPQTKVSEPVGPKHHYTPEAYQGVKNIPMAAVVGKEYRPGKIGTDGNRLRNKSLSQSSSVESSQSKSSFSTESRSANSDHFQHPLSPSSSCESTSNSKVSTPQRSDSGNQFSNQQQWDAVPTSQNTYIKNHVGAVSSDNEIRSQASSRSSSENQNSREPIPRVSEIQDAKYQNAETTDTNHKMFPPVFSETKHKPISQTVSLDNTSQATPMRSVVQKAPQPRSVVHSSSLDSSSTNYDPSVLLFTPSQTMQIAIHKAAINKQLSQEEERRQSTSSSRHGSFSKTYESEGMSSDGEEGGDEADEEYMSEDIRSESEEEDAEEENTVLQVSNGNIVHPQKYTEQQNMPTPYTTNLAYPEKKQTSNTRTENVYSGDMNINSVAKPYSETRSYKVPVDNRSMQPINDMNNMNKNNGFNVKDSANIISTSGVPSSIHPEARQNQNSNRGSTWTTDVAKHEFIYDQKTGNDVNMNTEIQNPSSIHNSSLHSNTNTSASMYPAASFQNAHDIGTVNNGTANVSSAQRLLQMATADTKVPPRYRSDKKVKMKRANTIDIPKPLNFYEIEDESDYASEDEYEDADDKLMNQNSANSQHRAAYLALRGPIRVGNGNKFPGDNKVPPPSFQPKTESDRKFLAFLKQHGSGSSQPSPAESFKVATYNPSARGGHHWSNRFSNIKTAFESSANKEVNQVDRGTKVAYGPAAARLFWQSADDSATVVKTRSSLAAANGPRLTRQGSQFLRQLFEQKDQEKQEQSKLPWTEKSVEENVVVGSLTVANTKGAPNSIYTKKQMFTPPPSPISQAPVKINKFSHAPMSAFRPVEKKSNQKPNDVSSSIAPPMANQPWASPSVSGNVKQLASQKFCAPQPPSNNSDALPNVTRTVKQRAGLPPQNLPQEALSPISPTLPWIRENTDNRSLNSAVAKFENMSRETSPQPVLGNVSHSRSAEKVAVPQSLIVNKQGEIAAPKTYLPPPNAAGIVQGRLQENNIFPNVQYVKEPPAIPKPPSLISPSLSVAQTFDSKQSFSKQDYRLQQEIMKSHQEKYSNKEKYSNQEVNISKQYNPQDQSGHIYQNSLNKSENFGHKQPIDKPHTHSAPQTYSGSVTSRTAVYPSALGNTSNLSAEKREKSPVSPLSLPLKNIPQNLDSPDMPSPEAFTAVSHVMSGPVSHQAVTVSQKPRHRYDEEGEEHKSSAARNLSSVLQLSMVKGDGEKTNALSVSKQNKSPSPDPRRVDQTSAPANEKSGMVRNKSEPDMQIIDSQLSEYQSSKRTATNDEKGFGKGQLPNVNGLPMSTRLRPASAESLIMATSTEELQESGESVLTTRLQIPVYNNVSGKVPSHRSGSLHDIALDRRSPYENGPASQSPLLNSHALHKSGSWHQLAPGQQAKPKRPQSLALPDLPTGNTGNARRGHSGLSKAKSSHSLAFPKQFEAALAPDTIETKKSKVEAYLSTSNLKTNDPNMRITQNKSPNTSCLKPNVPPKPEIPLLDDSLDNVEEAFEDLFNSTTGQPTKLIKNSSTKLKTKKIHHSEQVHSNQYQPSASSTQFVNKHGVWEEPSGVRGSRALNAPSHRLAHDYASK